MPSIRIDTEFAEREEFCYSFVIMSDVLQNKFLYSADLFTKLTADLRRELQSELWQYLDLLPLMASESHKLSLFTNCRRLLLSQREIVSLSTEETIARVLSNDPDEMTARVFVTADNNAHGLDFYRELLTKSIDAVKYCMQMEASENLRSLLLSMLVDREDYTKKIIRFADKTLEALRRLRSKYSGAIAKAYSVFDNTERTAENLLSIGIINENDEVVITPVILNPGVMLTRNVDGIKYAIIGTEYERSALFPTEAQPAVELETMGKIFSDPTRCEIIRILKSGSSYLSELARRLEVPSNSLHYHIQLLNDAHVIKGYYKGKKFIFELDPKFFQAISHTALQFMSSDGAVKAKP